jgi:eukaryotic-like serine/threonine-protein kinase
VVPPSSPWALGATLYFAVEGVSPFPGTSPIAVATAVVHGQRRQPSRAGPLTAIIDRLLRKEPGQRPTAGQVRRALRGARRSQPLNRTPRIPPPLDSTAAGAGAVGIDDTSSSSGNADQTEVFPILTAAPSGALERGDASNPSTGRGHAGDVATGPAVEQPPAGHNVSGATACNPAVSQVQGVAEPVATVRDVSISAAVHTGPVTCVSSELNDGKRHTGEAPTTRAFPRDEGADAAAPTAREPANTGADAAAPTAREPGNTVPADADDVVTTRDEAASGASGEAGESPTTTGMGVGVTVSAPALNGAGERRREALGPPLTNRRPRPERKGSGISGGRWVRLVMLVGGALGGLAILALAVLPTSETGGNGDSDGAADNKAATETTADTAGAAGTAADHTAAPTTATTDVRTTNPTATTSTTDIGAAQARPPTAGPQVPDGWIVFADPEGAYSIAHPSGWEVALGSRAHTVFIREPGTGTYLLVEWTPDPKPDPVADWEEQSKYFANRHEGYEELRIEPFPYRDYNAAMWEFRYRAGGTVLHAGNLNIVTAGRAYALYFQTREQRWHASQDTFTRFRQAFNPAP